MASFEILAGDFGTGIGLFSGKSFSLPIRGKTFSRQDLAACLLTSVQVATEENVKRLGGTMGWGLVGGALLGPAGLLAGLLLGGRKKKVVFSIEFRTGQKILASGDSSTYTAIQSAALDAPVAFAASLSAPPRVHQPVTSARIVMGCFTLLLWGGTIFFVWSSLSH